MPSGKEIIRRYESLRTVAAMHFTRCDRMAPYISPSRVGINGKRSPGMDQMIDVFDSTAMGAADLFSKYLASKIISRSQRWYTWKLRKPKGEVERNDGDEWIEECTDLALKERAKSNFYAEAPEMLNDDVGFGTGCMLVDERKQYRENQAKRKGFRGLRYQTAKTGRFVITEDEEGRVNGTWREYSVSAQAAADKWGKDNLPRAMQTALPADGNAGNPDKMFDIVHAVYSRPEGERGEYKGAKGYAYASCWVEKETQEVLEESGYPHFPFMVPRWEKTPGEVMGRGVGDRAFPDIRTLNKAKEMGLKDWALKIQPSILVAENAVIGSIRLRPNTPTVLRNRTGNVRDSMAPWETGSHPEVSQLKEEELRQSINKLFFVDLLRRLMEMDKPDVTAFQFAKQLELLYQILGTAYGQLETGFLIPETEIVWSLMYSNGAFPPPPQEIVQRIDQGEDIDIDVEFSSPFALAQKMGDVDAIRLTYGDVAALGLNDPQRTMRLLQNFDDDENVRLIAERRGMPEQGIRSTANRDKIREAIQKQQMDEAAQAKLTAASQIGKNVAPLLQATSQSQAA